jgi:tetratricopeptide (TPR) repeat protein
MMNSTAESDGSAPVTTRCRLCGVESEWKGGFVDQTSVIRGPHQVCITCFTFRKKYRDYYLSWLWWSSAALVFGYRLTGSIEGGVLFGVGIYAAAYLSIVLHELGHWLAATALGVHVAAMSFGGGLRTKTFKVRNTFVLFGPAPSEGLVLPLHRTARHYRWKQMLIVVAGPAVNAAAAIPGLILLVNTDYYDQGLAARSLLFWTIINAGLAICNLLPFRIKTAFTEQPSDGAQLLSLPKMSDERIDELIAARQRTLALLEFQYGDMNAGLAVIEDELERDDTSAHNQIVATALFAETGRLEKCIASGRKYLDSEGLAPMERAILQNNVANALFLTGDPAHLDEADTLSAMAMETLPMLLAVRSTRGAVLIASGRYREGVDLLTDKRFRMETRRHRARVACGRAQGEAHLGRLEKAAASLREAMRLDPTTVPPHCMAVAGMSTSTTITAATPVHFH